jgi:hypothetical protein
MDTSIHDALAASGWPLISSPPVPRVVLENPSTLELAVIGIATMVVYWAFTRRSTRDAEQATPARVIQQPPLRKAA